MNRGWSLLFLALPIAVIGSFAMAAAGLAPFERLWLPVNANQSEPGIDRLVNLLHVVVGVVLALTGLVFAAAIWRGTRGGAQPAASWSHNAWLEVLWTVIPAAILVWLSLSQYSAWNASRRDQPLADDGSGLPRRPLIRVVAQRFHWEFHHAGPDGVTGTADDLVRLNELVVPGDTDIVLELMTRDVVHSLGVPALRLKQDIVPGLKPLVWFRMKPGSGAEIVCTELCGWGHYLMQARIRAVEAQDYAREFGGEKAVDGSVSQRNDRAAPLTADPRRAGTKTPSPPAQSRGGRGERFVLARAGGQSAPWHDAEVPRD